MLIKHYRQHPIGTPIISVIAVQIFFRLVKDFYLQSTFKIYRLFGSLKLR